MTTERNVVDFKIHNLTEEQFQELKAQGQIDPNAVYCTPDESLKTDQITNCVTEIPQDIKLELADGVLTLKAGSKVYIANGNLGTTDTTTNDITYTQPNDGQYIVIRNAANSLYVAKTRSCLSGTIANRPTTLQDNAGLYFATDENKMYLTGDSGASWYSTQYMTLPIAIITVSGGAISSIDQVFNGVGYIGSTAFALPGVKGLVPDGRNADGTLKNRIMTVQNVLIKTIPSNTGWHYLTINASGTGWDFATNYYTGTELPSGATNFSRFYNTAENLTYNVVSGKLTQTPQLVLDCYIDHSISSPYKINSMKQATAFRAVDYNDYQNTVEELNNSISSSKAELNSSINAAKQELTSSINNVDSNAVHKTGDETIGGAKTFSSSITSETGIAKPAIKNTNGGQLWLMPSSNTTYNGGFVLRSVTSDGSFVDLTGKGSGTLMWNGKYVACTEAKSLASNGYVKFNNGLIIQWGTVTSTVASAWQTVTFPTAFTATPTVIAGNIDTYEAASASSHGYVMEKGAVTNNHTTTNFQIWFQTTNKISKYIAIGY